MPFVLFARRDGSAMEIDISKRTENNEKISKFISNQHYTIDIYTMLVLHNLYLRIHFSLFFPFILSSHSRCQSQNHFSCASTKCQFIDLKMRQNAYRERARERGQRPNKENNHLGKKSTGRRYSVCCSFNFCISICRYCCCVFFSRCTSSPSSSLQARRMCVMKNEQNIKYVQHKRTI